MTTRKVDHHHHLLSSEITSTLQGLLSLSLENDLSIQGDLQLNNYPRLEHHTKIVKMDFGRNLDGCSTHIQEDHSFRGRIKRSKKSFKKAFNENGQEIIAATSYCAWMLLILLLVIPSTQACSCLYPKSFSHEFCSSKYALILSFDASRNLSRSASFEGNAIRTAVRSQGNALNLRPRIQKRQLERETDVPTTLSSILPSKTGKVFKIQEIKQVIQMSDEANKAVSLSNALWFPYKTTSSCNPVDRIKKSRGPFLVWGGMSQDSRRLTMESCKIMEWNLLKESDKALIQSYIINGLPCR